jgi:hypothetical protein
MQLVGLNRRFKPPQAVAAYRCDKFKPLKTAQIQISN